MLVVEVAVVVLLAFVVLVVVVGVVALVAIIVVGVAVVVVAVAVVEVVGVVVVVVAAVGVFVVVVVVVVVGGGIVVVLGFGGCLPGRRIPPPRSLRRGDAAAEPPRSFSFRVGDAEANESDVVDTVRTRRAARALGWTRKVILRVGSLKKEKRRRKRKRKLMECLLLLLCGGSDLVL